MSPRLGHDIARYVPGLVIPVVLGALQTFVFARLASPEQLGTFLLVAALVASIISPASLWISQAILRFYPAYQQQGRAPAFVSAIMLVALGTAAVASLLVLGLLSLGLGGHDLPRQYALAAAAMAFFPVASGAWGAVLQASFAPGLFSLFGALSAVAKLAVPLALFPFLGPVGALLWGSATASMLMWALAIWRLGPRWSGQKIGLSDVKEVGKAAWHFGLPLSISELGVQVLMYSDRYAIAALIGTAAVGLYSTNYSIAEKLLILVQAPLIYAVHPHVMATWERGEPAQTRRLVTDATRILLLLGVPIIAFTAVRGDLVSTFLLGESFAPGHWVIPITATSVLLWAASQYGHKSFELAKDTWVITVTLAVAVAVNLVAVVLLTMWFGFIGGAIATLLGYATYAVLTWLVSHRRGTFPWDVPWKTLGHALLAAVPAACTWAVLTPHQLDSVSDAAVIVASGLLGCGLYILVVILFGEVPRSMVSGVLQRGRPGAWRKGDSATPVR